MGNSSRRDCVLIESGSSPVYIGSGSYPGLEFILESFWDNGVYVLVDEHTEQDCLPYLYSRIARLEESAVIRIPSGEEHKDLRTCEYIWQELLRCGASRNSILINLGGGVITDMGGFAASSFKRGMDFVNIPTTLMGQVDAAIGGKTGIDFRNIKNQIGLFVDPRAVIVDPAFLRTLSKREFISGFAELVKYALISEDEGFRLTVGRVEAGDMEGIAELIEKAVRMKSELAKLDKYDHGPRKMLNFGHTFGHALESFSMERPEGPALLHGEAVAVGMICEAFVSYKKKYLENEQLDWITELLGRWFSPFAINEEDLMPIVELMRYDKKNSRGKILAVLIDGQGKCFLDEEIHEEEILEALRFYRQFVQINSYSR